MAEPMIALSHVTKSFDGGRTEAVADVSLSIDKGGFIALVGGSGSGKTTTLKTINGLITPTFKWLLGPHGLSIVYVSPEFRKKLNLAGVGWVAREQIFQVSCSVNGACEATGHDAQGHTNARQQEYRRKG